VADSAPATHKTLCCLSGCFEAVTQRIVITPLQAAFLTLALASLDQVFQTTRPLCRGFSAFGATAFALFTQLVLALPGDCQTCEFVLNRSSHFKTLTTSILIFLFRPRVTPAHSKINYISDCVKGPGPDSPGPVPKRIPRLGAGVA